MPSIKRHLPVIAIILLFSTCKKDVVRIDYDRAGSLQLIFDRGDIQHIGATEHMCYFSKRQTELVSYEVWDSSFTYFNSLNSDFGDIVQIEPYNDSTVLIGDSKRGIRYFNKGKIYTYRAMGGLSNFNQSCDQVVVSFDRISYAASSFNQFFSLGKVFTGTDGITAATACSDSVWIGTVGGGVIQYHTTRYYRRYTTESTNLADDSIKDIQIENSNLWVLSKTGLSKKDGNDFITYSIPNGVVAQEMCFARGHIFITTNRGIYHLKNDQVVPYDFINDLLPDPTQITTMAADPLGQLWLGTKKGLYFYRPY